MPTKRYRVAIGYFLEFQTMQPTIVNELPTMTQKINWPRHPDGYVLIQVDQQAYKVYPMEDGYQANFCYRV